MKPYAHGGGTLSAGVSPFPGEQTSTDIPSNATNRPDVIGNFLS
jgi:hypothetical protein